jgi:hypothetical protein
VLTQAPGLFQHGDVEVATSQAGKLDGAGEAGWPGSHDHHIHLDGLGAWRVAEDQGVKWELALVADREDCWQGGALLEVRKTGGT